MAGFTYGRPTRHGRHRLDVHRRVRYFDPSEQLQGIWNFRSTSSATAYENFTAYGYIDISNVQVTLLVTAAAGQVAAGNWNSELPVDVSLTRKGQSLSAQQIDLRGSADPLRRNPGVIARLRNCTR